MKQRPLQLLIIWLSLRGMKSSTRYSATQEWLACLSLEKALSIGLILMEIRFWRKNQSMTYAKCSAKVNRIGTSCKVSRRKIALFYPPQYHGHRKLVDTNNLQARVELFRCSKLRVIRKQCNQEEFCNNLIGPCTILSKAMITNTR